MITCFSLVGLCLAGVVKSSYRVASLWRDAWSKILAPSMVNAQVWYRILSRLRSITTLVFLGSLFTVKSDGNGHWLLWIYVASTHVTSRPGYDCWVRVLISCQRSLLGAGGSTSRDHSKGTGWVSHAGPGDHTPGRPFTVTGHQSRCGYGAWAVQVPGAAT